MKVKDYVKKYGLEKKGKVDFDSFLDDLEEDFLKLFYSQCKKDNDDQIVIPDYRVFKNSVISINDKWQRILAEGDNVPEVIWRVFYGKRICTLREQYYPDIHRDIQTYNKKQKNK